MVAGTLKGIVVLASLITLSSGSALADTIELNGLPCNDLCQWWMGVRPVDRLRTDLRSAQEENQPLEDAPMSPRKHAATHVKKKHLAHRVAEKGLDRRIAGKLPLAPPAQSLRNPIDASRVEPTVAPVRQANASPTAPGTLAQSTSQGSPAPGALPDGQAPNLAEPPAAAEANGAAAALPQASAPAPVAPPDSQAAKMAEPPAAPEADVAGPVPKDTPAPLAAPDNQLSKPAENPAPEVNASLQAAAEDRPPVAAPDSQALKLAELPAAPDPDPTATAPKETPAPVVPPDGQASKPADQPTALDAGGAMPASPQDASAPVASPDSQALKPAELPAPIPDVAHAAAPDSPTPAAQTPETAQAPTDEQAVASADPPSSPSQGRVLILLARPDIKQITDVGDSSIILAGSFAASKAQITTALSAASAKTVTVVEGTGRDIDRLIDGEVRVVVAALLSPAAAKEYPELSGLNVFRVPLSPP